MPKLRWRRGSAWVSLPKVAARTRSLTTPAVTAPVARPDAPLCACGCGRRILPVAEQYGSPYYSRGCCEKHLRIGNGRRGA
jgi:hypothetical protein